MHASDDTDNRYVTVRRLLVVVLMALGAPSMAHAGEQRIVGGQDATREYPFQALVEPTWGNDTFGCGGSLVAARYVVTAAHCVYGPGGQLPSRVDIALGVLEVDNLRQLQDPDNTVPDANKYLDIQPSAIQRHANYTDGLVPDNDVAVIRLPRVAPEEQIGLVRAADTALWAPEAPAVATGWGVTDFEEYPSMLQEVALPMVSDSACGAYYGGDFEPATMVCAGGQPGRDTCQGDSGGPLMVAHESQDILVGVTSWGDACGAAAGVYTRVGASALNDWIRDRVPQVDLTRSGSTFTAEPRHPLHSGEFGGYDAIEWDLDDDGAFDDAAGVTTVTHELPPGARVSVRASASTGDVEVRSLVMPAAPKPASAVAFSGAALTVTEGQPVALTVVKQGAGSGTVLVTPRSETASVDGIDLTGAAQTVSFAADVTSRVVTFATVADTLVEPAETFRVDLGGHAGELVPGSPGSVTVTIVDDDVPPPPPATAKLVSVGKRVLRVMTTDAGSLRAGARDRGGRVLARVKKRTVAAGTHKLTLKLTKAGRRALRRRRRVRVTLTVVYTPAAGLPITLTTRRYLR